MAELNTSIRSEVTRVTNEIFHSPEWKSLALRKRESSVKTHRFPLTAEFGSHLRYKILRWVPDHSGVGRDHSAPLYTYIYLKNTFAILKILNEM